jgi:hypothetical protein
MKTNFGTLYFKMFYKPESAFEAIFESDKALKYGFSAFLIPSLGYTLFYIMAYFAGGSPSTFKPWLAIPFEDYFKYDIILTLPGYYLSWIGASVTVYLLSRLMNGKSKFDNILAIIGFGIGIATWSSLLHDLTDAFLSITGAIDMREYEQLLNEPTFWRGLLWSLYTLYFFWFLTLFTIGIRKAQGFSLFKSIIIALVGLFTFQVILLIFIR